MRRRERRKKAAAGDLYVCERDVVLSLLSSREPQ
jgi:hypothetical protein